MKKDMTNQLITALSFLLFFQTSYSQEIRVSSDMPESAGRIVGFWEGKLISMNTTLVPELQVLDTTFEKPKVKTFKIGPQADDAKKVGTTNCFIHEDFIYEIDYVFTNTVLPGHAGNAKGYTVIVKRDLRTMQIVSQRMINRLNTQVKFVKTLEEGFYVCLGDSYMSHGRGLNYMTVSNPTEIIPTLIKGFDYDLEPLASLDLSAYESRLNPYLNEISVDEHSVLSVPIIQKMPVKEQGKQQRGAITFLRTNFSGDSLNISLEYELEEGLHVSSVKVRFDKKFAVYKGIFMVNRSSGETAESDSKYGYVYQEWDESGKSVQTKLVQLKKTDLITSIGMTNPDFDDSKVSRLNLDANVLLFEFLPDGSALYVVNTIASPNFMKITNSKCILCISADGELKWTKILPYSSNELYANAFFFLQNDELHVYTKEFIRNFSSGSYQYDDSRGIANGLSVVMTERVMDLDDGKVITHKPLIHLQSAKYDLFWPVTILSTNEYLLRYRFTKGNKDKWVRIAY
ncbi:hypothetical protein [uncultured Fluviicola sp.]|uniref:hypothetical protein n=1 Tax=uncultured Fluviicola sp. TaxID=463303 RepID=UPI0025DDD7F9|nr:hypothetical protein [uncultured Fluviicola sp.]